MLKYRGNKLIRTGFIGVVLAILIVLVGLSPETLTSMATAIRYQAQFSDAGGLTPGNDVTIAGIKVGSVSDVGLAGPQRAGDVHHRRHGRTRFGHHRTCANRNASRRTCADLGVRGRRHHAPDGRHPGDAHRIALLADRSRQRADDQHRGHRHLFSQPVAGHAVGDAGSGCATTRSGVRRHHQALAGHQRPRRHPWRAALRRRRRHQDSCPTAAHR